MFHLQYFGKTDYRFWWVILLQGTKWLTSNVASPTNVQIFLWALQKNVAFSKLGRSWYMTPKSGWSLTFIFVFWRLNSIQNCLFSYLGQNYFFLHGHWATHSAYISCSVCQTEEKNRGSLGWYIYSSSREDISIKRVELLPDAVKVSWSCQGRYSSKIYGFWQNKQVFHRNRAVKKTIQPLF